MGLFFAFLLFVVFAIAMGYGTKIYFKQRINDSKQIKNLSDYALKEKYNNLHLQLRALPKTLMHGDIHKHSRITRNMSLIEKEFKKRGIKS